MPCHCLPCLQRRAATLSAAASQTSEFLLLRTASWLADRYARHPSPSLSREIALHFLLIADHPAVRPDSLRRQRYRRCAAIWATAHHPQALPQESRADSLMIPRAHPPLGLDS